MHDVINLCQKGAVMKRDLIKVLAMIIIVGAVSGCAGPLKVGTGQKFTQAVNPEPDKLALVYFFRKDSAFVKGPIDFPPYLVEKNIPGDPERFPDIILGEKMYRPMLLEPGDVTFSVRASGSETLTIKAGETHCIDASRSFRGIIFIGVSELSLDECLDKMKGLELAMTITQIRRSKGLTPLLQPGFKDLDQ
jgi:hypothetical protein